ncbi:MAG: hypothetical protein SFV32_12575 [Opitutaceae bacterium]|nr:hypothetical protein [Opitutaceae bacterium]
MSTIASTGQIIPTRHEVFNPSVPAVRGFYAASFQRSMRSRKHARGTIRFFVTGKAHTMPMIGFKGFWAEFYAAVDAERVHIHRAKRRRR